MWGRARRRSRLLVTSSAQACFLPSGKNAFPCLVVLILTSQYIGCASRSAAAASARFIPQRSRRVDGDFGSPRSRRVCFRGSTSSFALSLAACLHREERSRQSDEDSAEPSLFPQPPSAPSWISAVSSRELTLFLQRLPSLLPPLFSSFPRTRRRLARLQLLALSVYHARRWSPHLDGAGSDAENRGHHRGWVHAHSSRTLPSSRVQRVRSDHNGECRFSGAWGCLGIQEAGKGCRASPG